MQIQRIELGVVSVPLHDVYFSFELLTGRDIVGTRFTLSIKEIPLTLRNNLAGSKVDLQLVSDYTATMEVNGVESSIFPACAVTRVAAKRA